MYGFERYADADPGTLGTPSKRNKKCTARQLDGFRQGDISRLVNSMHSSDKLLIIVIYYNILLVDKIYKVLC